jgi:hypothetical protein
MGLLFPDGVAVDAAAFAIVIVGPLDVDVEEQPARRTATAAVATRPRRMSTPPKYAREVLCTREPRPRKTVKA